MTPTLFLYLVNLCRPRRAGHVAHDRDLPGIADLLVRLNAPSGGKVHPELDQLAQAASELADAIVTGRMPLPVDELNAMARRAIGYSQLVADPARVALQLEHTKLPAEPAAVLAARVIAELDAADLSRIKECGRTECRLVFYDNTRSRTQHWHAESPCGGLERQRRHRTR